VLVVLFLGSGMMHHAGLEPERLSYPGGSGSTASSPSEEARSSSPARTAQHMASVNRTSTWIACTRRTELFRRAMPSEASRRSFLIRRASSPDGTTTSAG
jgi:hypothetical protein